MGYTGDMTHELSSDRPHSVAAREAYLASHGLQRAEVVALPADASPRRYFRVLDHDCLLVQVPPNDTDQITFAKVADHLIKLGFSAPRTLDADSAAGFALVEDFGTESFAKVLARTGDETSLYARVIDILAALHDLPVATDINLPPYDADFLLEEVAIFLDWYVPFYAPKLDSPAFRADFLDLWRDALRPVADSRDALVLRDLHLDNLMHLPARTGLRQTGLLDIQGARIGSRAYDLASLLQDARRDLAHGLAEAMLSRYAAARPGTDAQETARRYHILAAQRHTKVAGIFARLAHRDNKHGYLVHMPRVLSHLSNALDAAELRAMNQLVGPALRTGGAL